MEWPDTSQQPGKQQATNFQMKLAISLLVLVANGFIPLAYSGQDKSLGSPVPIPLCTVLKNPEKYDGKEIIVEGLYRMVIHGSILYGSACPQTNVNMRKASNWKGDKKASAVLQSLTEKDQFQPVVIVLRGTFRVAHQGQCFGQNCLVYEIEETELLRAAQTR